ncbi:hypothetical protein CDAR_594071 [Caerostris darwini]|uniref:Uncharacterized protein n=1 Tax=Caerostris darwini TaxID=1538125 RepID=A0AAV4RJN4_9ARAC|nr:hypothetical protein CDAR_594071 [Caerostris darwini]
MEPPGLEPETCGTEWQSTSHSAIQALQQNQNIIKLNVSFANFSRRFLRKLFKTASISQPQTPPITEMSDSSGLFSHLQLLKELQLTTNYIFPQTNQSC